MGLFGPPNVEKMRAQRDVNGLIKALGYQKDRNVCWKAAEALGEIGDTRAVEPLALALNGDDVERGVHAALALGRIRDARAVQPLLGVLVKTRMGEGFSVLTMKIGDPSIERKELEDRLRQAAAEALGAIGDTRAVAPLIAMLESGNYVLYDAAARALGNIGDARAVAPLIAALGKSNSAAAEALGQIGDARALAPLIAALQDGLAFNRYAVANGLGLMRDARAVAPLIAVLNGNDRIAREAAAHALARIGAPSVAPLIAALVDSGSGEIRVLAIEALGQIGDARAVEWLAMATGDSAATIRQAAVSALESMGWRPGKDEGAACYWAAKGRWDKCGEIGAAAVGPLVTVLKEGDRASRDGAQGALIAIGAAAVAPMIAALKEGKLKAAPDVIEALGEIRDNRAVTPLIDVLRGKDIYARKSAVRALVKVGDAHALGGICAALQDSKVGLDVALDAAGICGSKLGNATIRDLTFKRLCDALRSGETGLRKRAAGSLGSMDDPRVVAPLIGALADANCDVRSAAAKVLIGLYQSRLLDNAQRHNILEQRHRISARHEDFTSSDCGHHTDVGIGMAFPA